MCVSYGKREPRTFFDMLTCNCKNNLKLLKSFLSGFPDIVIKSTGAKKIRAGFIIPGPMYTGTGENGTGLQKNWVCN